MANTSNWRAHWHEQRKAKAAAKREKKEQKRVQKLEEEKLKKERKELKQEQQKLKESQGGCFAWLGGLFRSGKGKRSKKALNGDPSKHEAYHRSPIIFYTRVRQEDGKEVIESVAECFMETMVDRHGNAQLNAVDLLQAYYAVLNDKDKHSTGAVDESMNEISLSNDMVSEANVEHCMEAVVQKNYVNRVNSDAGSKSEMIERRMGKDVARANSDLVSAREMIERKVKKNVNRTKSDECSAPEMVDKRMKKGVSGVHCDLVSEKELLDGRMDTEIGVNNDMVLTAEMIDRKMKMDVDRVHSDIGAAREMIERQMQKVVSRVSSDIGSAQQATIEHSAEQDADDDIDKQQNDEGQVSGKRDEQNADTEIDKQQKDERVSGKMDEQNADAEKDEQHEYEQVSEHVDAQTTDDLCFAGKGKCSIKEPRGDSSKHETHDRSPMTFHTRVKQEDDKELIESVAEFHTVLMVKRRGTMQSDLNALELINDYLAAVDKGKFKERVNATKMIDRRMKRAVNSDIGEARELSDRRMKKDINRVDSRATFVQTDQPDVVDDIDKQHEDEEVSEKIDEQNVDTTMDDQREDEQVSEKIDQQGAYGETTKRQIVYEKVEPRMSYYQDAIVQVNEEDIDETLAVSEHMHAHILDEQTDDDQEIFEQNKFTEKLKFIDEVEVIKKCKSEENIEHRVNGDCVGFDAPDFAVWSLDGGVKTMSEADMAAAHEALETIDMDEYINVCERLVNDRKDFRDDASFSRYFRFQLAAYLERQGLAQKDIEVITGIPLLEDVSPIMAIW